MAKHPKRYSPVLTWVIRILIIVIFCVAVVITLNRLVEYAQAGGTLQAAPVALLKSGYFIV